MVSKSKILGKCSLILVSVGSTKFSYLRLSSALNKIDKSKYKIIGNFTSPNQFVKMIGRADKIIIHGGPATLYLVVKYAKVIPLVLPRLSKFHEHINNHQLFFIKFLKTRLPDSLKKYFVTEEKIDTIIKDYLKEGKKVNNLGNYLFLKKNINQLTENLDAYIN